MLYILHVNAFHTYTVAAVVGFVAAVVGFVAAKRSTSKNLGKEGPKNTITCLHTRGCINSFMTYFRFIGLRLFW